MFEWICVSLSSYRWMWGCSLRSEYLQEESPPCSLNCTYFSSEGTGLGTSVSSSIRVSGCADFVRNAVLILDLQLTKRISDRLKRRWQSFSTACTCASRVRLGSADNDDYDYDDDTCLFGPRCICMRTRARATTQALTVSLRKCGKLYLSVGNLAVKGRAYIFRACLSEWPGIVVEFFKISIPVCVHFILFSFSINYLVLKDWPLTILIYYNTKMKFEPI